MISLSLYCSTQTMSVALYNKRILIEIFKKKVIKNKIDNLPLIVEKILVSNGIKKIDRIIFSRGPGSYTANRSIKALAQGLSLANNSKLTTLNNFEVFVGNINNNYENAIVLIKDVNNKFFVNLFSKEKNRYFCKENFFYHINSADLKKLLLKKFNKSSSTVIISNHKDSLKKYKNIDYTIEYISPDASHLANSFFNGYGTANLEIIYHHTYYK